MTQDVSAWLEGLGLGRYASLFQANDLDASLLHRLTREDLPSMGIASPGHRCHCVVSAPALVWWRAELSAVLGDPGPP